MSCGSAACTSAISITVPAVRLVAPELPAIPWRVPAQTVWARVAWLADRRRQRRALLDLDDRLLADIGISRADAVAEARKPSWL